MALLLLAIGAVAYLSQKQDDEYNDPVVYLPVCYNQKKEDRDNGILLSASKNNGSVAYSEEIGGIVRSDNYSEIHDIYNNALDFTSRSRLKNQTLGELNFSPNNVGTILLPSNGVKILPMTVPNPAVFPDYEKIPNAWLDRKTPNVTSDNDATNYKTLYGSNISPFNIPKQPLLDVVQFGNPWGIGGIYNKNIREGGNRLTGKFDAGEKKKVTFPF